ncbi:MAG TPA: hypothetical protein VJ925_08970 [Longimicrobiales bacterium]|nr:hypothetical protein [Longimicrobiales bacterium]
MRSGSEVSRDPRSERDTPSEPLARLEWDAGLEGLVRLSAALASGSADRLEAGVAEAARVCEPLEVEEALLQSYLFLGFPSALNAFAVWRRVSGRAAPDVPDEVGADPLAAWEARGERTCRRVYGRAYDGLRENIGRLQPDLDRWMVQEGYGKVLSRPGLTLGRRECCIAAILAVKGAKPQFRSHLRGALRCGLEVEAVDRLFATIDPYLNESTRRDAHAVRDVVVEREET